MSKLTGFLSSRGAIIFSVGGALAAIALFLLLVVPPLIKPPPEVGPGYDVFNDRMAASTVDPGQDQLVELSESDVAVFIPAGAFGGRGQLLLKERRQDLVPFRQGEDYSRDLAVDLLFVNPEGNVLTQISLQEPLLLCFELSTDQIAAYREDDAAFAIQVFDEFVDPPEWLNLKPARGWQESQICGHVEHLSLFALARSTEIAVDSGRKSAPTAEPVITVVPPELYEPPEATP